MYEIEINDTIKTTLMFVYTETDDTEHEDYVFCFEEVRDMIKQHNNYFDTNYKTIQEFNNNEPHRKIVLI